MSRLQFIAYNEDGGWGLDEVGDDELERDQDEAGTVSNEA